MSGPIVLVLRILLALALTDFLGWALWTIWQDLKQDRFPDRWHNKVRCYAPRSQE